MGTDQDDVVYTLHFFPFSLYSLMVRFGFVLGQKLNPKTAPRVELKLVNSHREENLSEQYLTLVNPKGQVPALTSPALPSPITDSRDISRWLCEKQPELVPEQHRADIQRLMDKIYSFHAMGLMFNPDAIPDGIPNTAAAMLEKSDLTESHRRALEIKILFHDSSHRDTLQPERLREVNDQARDFFGDLETLLIAHNQGMTWIFGDQPTILDAHATVLAARLVEKERQDLLPERVKEYVKVVKETEEWYNVTHGRKTVWDISVGHVADLSPL